MFFLLVCFVLISLLVPYISNVPLYRRNIVLYIRPRPYKHSQIYVKLSVISLFYLKVGGGQLESFHYFDHHTHFITRNVQLFYFAIIYCDYIFFLCYSL